MTTYRILVCGIDFEGPIGEFSHYEYNGKWEDGKYSCIVTIFKGMSVGLCAAMAIRHM